MKIFFILLIAFQVKHLIADYFLQTEYMLQKTLKTGWVFPLSLHCLVHALLTMAICVLAEHSELVWIAVIDFGIHFTTDRIKALWTQGMSPANASYWNALGIDQAVHHCTHYLCIWILVTAY